MLSVNKGKEKIIFMRKRAVHRVYGKHCSCRHNDFLLVVFSFNALYGVTPFKQAQTVHTKKSKIEM